jgi:magnesium-transporting ATPase (P-type)
MLTGDKLETAENIGYSCRLIQQDFQKMYIMETDDLRSKYGELAAKVGAMAAAGQKKTLLVEGKAISRLG